MLGSQWKEVKFVIYRSEGNGKLVAMNEVDWSSWERKMQVEYGKEEWAAIQRRYPKVAEGLTAEEADRFIALTKEN